VSRLRAGRKRPVVLPTMPAGSRRQSRLVARGPEQGPLRLGNRVHWYSDIYHRTLVIRWPVFLLAGCGIYLGANVVFAGLYLLRDGSIDHARPGSFADAFFFSIQTMATIGYGVLTPVGTYANVVMTVETIVSLLFAAFITGLTFSRFSRPTARVNFSKVATIGPYNGRPTLSVRLSNSRRNQILEADVRLVLLRTETTQEGSTMRRFYDLPLARGHTPVFSLTFTAMHFIDAASPFYGATPEMLASDDSELLVTVTGLDETMSQTIHARWSYLGEEIMFGQRFRDMFGYTPEGRLVIDHRFFDEVEAVPDEVSVP
jgi:inward rectifier potassium channel